jgi:hypothetical protein
MLTKANSRLSECNYRAENDGVEWKAFRWLGHALVPKCLKVWERRRVPKRPDRIAEVGRLSLNVPECEINSAADSLLSFGNLVLPKPLCRAAHHQQAAIEQRYVNSRNIFPGQMPHLENSGCAEAYACDDWILTQLRLVILMPGDAVCSRSVKIQKNAVVFRSTDRFDSGFDRQQQFRPGMRLH